MTDHPTLEPTTAVRIRAGEPSGAAAAAAAFADLVCADHELLQAEFDAIIAANFPGAAEHRHPPEPDTTVVAAAELESPHRWPAPSDRRPARGWVTAAQKLRARQRGPPTDPAARDKDDDRRSRKQEVVDRLTRHNCGRCGPRDATTRHRASTCYPPGTRRRPPAVANCWALPLGPQLIAAPPTTPCVGGAARCEGSQPYGARFPAKH